MINTPAFFQSWAASIHHEDNSEHESRITYKFHFTTKPHILRFLLDPIMERVFVWETKKRFQALRAFIVRDFQRSEADMTGDNGPREDFGCEGCWPPSADAAWEARGALTHVVELIDESHFHVMILACPACTQRFVSVFTETLDWEDGDDPQYWKLLPITKAEATNLVQQRDSLTEAKLDALGRGRRCLRRDHPKAAAPCLFWGTGICVGLHD